MEDAEICGVSSYFGVGNAPCAKDGLVRIGPDTSRACICYKCSQSSLLLFPQRCRAPLVGSIMAKSRRLGRLLQALQGQQNSSSGFGTGSERSGQHAPRNLRALSKRLTAGFRSTLGRKTPLRHSDMPESPPTGYGDDPLTMEDAQETSRPDHANQGHPRPLSPGQRIQKRSAEHGRESEHDTAVPPGVSCVSTTEEIINWVHQRSIPGDEAPPPDTLPSLQSNALPKGDDHVNQCESSSPEHSRTASVARPVQARGSQKKKSRGTVHSYRV